MAKIVIATRPSTTVLSSTQAQPYQRKAHVMLDSKSSQILTPFSDSVEGTLACPGEWQKSLKGAIRSGVELCETLGVSFEEACPEAESDFPVFAPREFVSRMEKGNPRDPLFLQVIASQAELAPGGLSDPVGDMETIQTPGLLQKYDGRVLLVTSGACAIHCRYCFRREFPYNEVPKGREAWESWLEHLKGDDSIHEVLLSGGDPLSIVDDTLAWFIEELNGIEHIRRIRVHTRFPVVIPNRVDAKLIRWIRSSNKAMFFVLHFNHANEIDDSVLKAVSELQRAGATILNQSVLLKNVNDSFESQRALCTKLVDAQIMPYYLHQLDPVRGALHFEVSDAVALAIVEQLRSALPGYAVPRLVREISGEPSKTVVA